MGTLTFIHPCLYTHINTHIYVHTERGGGGGTPKAISRTLVQLSPIICVISYVNASFLSHYINEMILSSPVITDLDIHHEDPSTLCPGLSPCCLFGKGGKVTLLSFYIFPLFSFCFIFSHTMVFPLCVAIFTRGHYYSKAVTSKKMSCVD